MTNRTVPVRAATATSTAWILTAGAFYAFFIFGFVDNLKGPILPVLLRELDFSYSLGGTMLLGAYLGFLMATLLTGILADVVGNRAILAAAGLLLSAGILLFSLSSTFLLLTTGMALIGLGMGSIEVGGNALIVQVHHAQRGRFLNLLGVFHGTGALTVPLVATFLLAQGTEWRQIYQMTALLTAALAVYFLLVRDPRPLQAEGAGLQLAALRRTGFTFEMSLYYLLLTVYVAAELGIAAWIVEFLQVEKGMEPAGSSLYLSLFFVFIMIGRLSGSFVVERIGYLRIVFGAAIASIAFLSVGIYGPPPLAIFVSLTGLFFSIIFPTVTASVSQRHLQNTGSILGLLFAFGGLGGALGPWAMGVANDLIGVRNGFALTILYCVIMMAAAFALVRRQGHGR